MTASTTNYLWSLQDVLGQGATASVFRARNKASPPNNKSFITTCHCCLHLVSFSLATPGCVMHTGCGCGPDVWVHVDVDASQLCVLLCRGRESW